jgi:hypothetical protein
MRAMHTGRRLAMKPPPATREISDASSASTRAGRAVIRSVENLRPMDCLRARTYRLPPTPIADLGYGFDFEDVC